MNDDPLELNTNRLLICEGKEEKALVSQMISEGLVEDIDLFALGDASHAGGIGALADNLDALPALSGFHRISSIGVFVDNDSEPADAFSGVRRALQSVHNDVESGLHGRLSIPNQPAVKDASGPISVHTFFSPGRDRNGCLETLLLEVLQNICAAKLTCVEELVMCSGIRGENPAWAEQKIDKAKMRAALAIIYRKNPAVTLAMLWRNDPNVLPVSNPLLQPVVDFINQI